MIKVEVTHLKAPWPAGAIVGSVVLLAVASLPAWAVGKCKPVPDDDEREPAATWEPAAPADIELVVNPAAEADRKAAESAAMLEALGQQLQDAEQALATARAEIQSLGAQLVEAHTLIEQVKAFCASAEEGQAAAVRERDAALAELQAMREATPAPVGANAGDGADDPAPTAAEEAKATPAKASKKGAA
jgi:hypothetical protein